MKTLKDIILEKLIINKNSKVKQQSKSVADIDIPWKVTTWFNVYSPKQQNAVMDKMIRYKQKNSNQAKMANGVAKVTELAQRWYCAVLLEWDEAIKAYGEQIELRGYTTIDILSAYLYQKCYYRIGTWKPSEYRQDGIDKHYDAHLEHYFDLYNIEYTKK